MTEPPAPNVPARTLPVLRLEHLWVGFALSLVAAFISLVPTTPHDFWWHLKVGELITTGGIPTTNRFAWAVPADTPYVYQSWLGEWLFFQIYQLGGFQLAIFARNLLGATAYALVAWEARERSGSWRLAALAVLPAAAMTINNFAARTQNWSWLPFMLILVLLGRYVRGRLAPRWLSALPLIMIFWVNAHGAFVLGLLVAGAFAVGETLRRQLRQPGALYWDQLRPLYLAVLGMAVAMLVNPRGPGIMAYITTIFGDTSIQQLVSEWQSPTPHNLAGAAFYLGVLALIAAFAFARRHPSITDVLLVCGLAWLAFGGVRHVVWFGMAAMPIMAQALAGPRPVGALSGRERGGGTVANLAVAGLLLAGVIALQPWTKPYLGLPTTYQDIFAPVPDAPQLFSIDTPVAAVAQLRAEPCTGRIFNEMGYGSYMAWALYPDAQPYIDPRIELFDAAIWARYVAVSKGQEVRAFLDEQQVACVVLDTETQSGLASALPTLQGWTRTLTGRSEIWRRSGQ